MAKLRLNMQHRTSLNNYIAAVIEKTEPREALDTLYADAEAVITKKVREDNPQSDMKVLSKYQLASSDDCVPFVREGFSEVSMFNYREESDIPLRPRSQRGCGWHQRAPIALEHAGYKTVSAYLDEVKARAQRVSARKKAYATLIAETRYYEDLVAVWPGAEALRASALGGSVAVSVISPALIEKLRDDPANAVLA